MTEIADLLADVLDHASRSLASNPTTLLAEARECDGCGEARPDVDFWATNDETCEEIWLCQTCGKW